jgi:cytosine/adenosine deaminase-related metal-dependent hydrolase
MSNVDCTFLLPAAHARPLADRSIRIDNGRIAAIGDRKPGHGRSTLVMPALVNAHDHARAVRSSSFGADGKPLVYGPSQPIVDALPAAARADVEQRFLKPPLPVADMMATVDAVASNCDQPEFNVQYGPTGVQ